MSEIIDYGENLYDNELLWVDNYYLNRGGSKAAATSKMEHFVIIVNGFQSITIITKCSILDVAAALDPPLLKILFYNFGFIITFYLFSWVRSSLTNFVSIHGFYMDTSKFCFTGIWTGSTEDFYRPDVAWK